MANKSPKNTWKKGQSGNPKGRAVSIFRKEALNDMLVTGVPEVKNVFNNVIEQAKQGNVQASRLFLEYVVPKPNNEAEKEDDLLDNLSEEENVKLYDYISSLIPEDEVQKFVNTAKKVTSYVKEMKLNRTSIV